MKKSKALHSKRTNSAFSMESVFVVCSILIYLGLPVDYLVFNMSAQNLMLFFVSGQSMLLLGIALIGVITELFAKKPTLNKHRNQV